MVSSIISKMNSSFEWLRVDKLQTLNQLKLSKLYAGEEIVDLSMINPDLEPPRFLLDKLVESSLHADRHRYAVSRGIRKLREAFVYKYKNTFHVDLNPEVNVCSCMGSKEGLLHTLTTLNSRQSKALLGSPTYSVYSAALDLCGVDYDIFHISNNEEAMLAEIDAMTVTQEYSILLLNFPNNPTGVVVSRSFYDRLHKLASERGFFIINDFVYGEMEYDLGVAESLLASDGALEHSVEIYSLSKAYSVPGWRVGGVLGNEEVIAKLGRLKSKTDYGIFLPIQDATSAALTSTSNLTLPIMDKYRRRSRIMTLGLQALSWKLTAPKAGACVWAKIPEELNMDDNALAYRLLDEFNVMVLPGSSFGENYHEYLRFALVASEDKLQLVLDALSSLSLCVHDSETNKKVMNI